MACSDDSNGTPDSGVTSDSGVTPGQDASTDSDSGGNVDGGVEPTEWVKAGTGVDMYEALTEGQTVELIQGPQGGGDRFGGFHIWGGLEAKGFDPNGIECSFFVLTANDRTELAAIRDRPLVLEPTARGTYVAHSITMILNDCCPAVSSDLIIRVTVKDSNGKTGEDEVTVKGASQCFDALSSMSACP